MNYGRFYRLNRTLSEIENGIAIYDYVDLPAYFSPSEDNHMSPKYPISIIISSSSVIFRLHYSAFKIEEQKRGKNDGTKNNYPYYTYDSISLTVDNEEKYKPGDEVKVAHMEEVILEIPFVDNATSLLSDTIKDIYSTPFPQLIENTSTGGRFLEQLINKRYPKAKNWKSLDDLKKKGDVEDLLYGTLRESSDDSPSYSTLWLMDLMRNVKGHENKKRINLYDENDGRSIVAFLRKLLLDFMFDLKHSDVFQNSVHYQKMYSGLMSDFYFSALMHKCEYYYYRKLTSQAIDDLEKTTLSKKEKKERKKAITSLYAYELIKAEDLWIKDIMNPLAENVFEHKYPGQHPILREFVESYNFEQWPSWFAEPEEEMRRVCFTMKDKNGKDHICNAETLIRYLDFYPNNTLDIFSKMSDQIDDNKERISRWFLKHYAFSDVLHLHLFKYTNVLFLLLIAFPALISLFTLTSFWIIWVGCLIAYSSIYFLIITLHYFLIRRRTTKQAFYRFNKIRKIRQHRIGVINDNDHVVLARRNVITQRRVIFIVSFLLLIVFILLREVNPIYPLLLLSICIAFTILFHHEHLVSKIRSYTRHLISSLHLLFPRLAASIALAWITLSMGFDLYVSYFDCQLNWYYIICIALIVVVFVMYEINRITPYCSPLRKFLRSVELLIISYFISLLVGVIVINFLGEKYLERGGYMQEYYDQYVMYNGYRNIRLDTDSIKQKYPNQNNTMKSDTSTKVDSLYMICQRILAKMDTTKKESIYPQTDSMYLMCQSVLSKIDTLNGADTSSFSRKLVDSLVYVYREIDISKCDNNNGKKQYIAAKERFWGMNVFILRNFLIMFSFIAMFTGIFIQLIIFGDNKQMTEL